MPCPRGKRLYKVTSFKDVRDRVLPWQRGRAERVCRK